jgi:hypothetical protein
LIELAAVGWPCAFAQVQVLMAFPGIVLTVIDGVPTRLAPARGAIPTARLGPGLREMLPGQVGGA